MASDGFPGGCGQPCEGRGKAVSCSGSLVLGSCLPSCYWAPNCACAMGADGQVQPGQDIV